VRRGGKLFPRQSFPMIDAIFVFSLALYIPPILKTCYKGGSSNYSIASMLSLSNHCDPFISYEPLLLLLLLYYECCTTQDGAAAKHLFPSSYKNVLDVNAQ
jgi:hypothetical protein